MSNAIKVIAQGFYGNRTVTDVYKNEIDNFILGHMNNPSITKERVDRSIINVPNADNVVIVYNKYQEEEELNRKEELMRENNYELKPLVTIPEENIVLYSRCIAARINKNGELESLENDDLENLLNYLA